jgi:hypothetical protein
MKFILAIFFVCQLALSQTVLSDLTLKEDHIAVNINQFNWLAAHWKGSGLGGQCDELWLPAIDNTMHGVFRFHMYNNIIFTEYMVLEKLEDNIYLKIKHFNKDLSPWEDKNDWTIFPFIKLEKEAAYFKGITFVRKQNELKIYLSMKKNEEVVIETFELFKN